ncbi:MAG: hypothetical protein WKG07_29860 [Hymenobacter sp.]
MGTAPRATFHLCITEDVSSESPMEEANWLAAAEYADSTGVDVISSSPGLHHVRRPGPLAHLRRPDRAHGHQQPRPPWARPAPG